VQRNGLAAVRHQEIAVLLRTGPARGVGMVVPIEPVPAGLRTMAPAVVVERAGPRAHLLLHPGVLETGGDELGAVVVEDVDIAVVPVLLRPANQLDPVVAVVALHPGPARPVESRRGRRAGSERPFPERPVARG